MDITESRWRMKDRNGRTIWLKFDPAFPCIYCNEPVTSLSSGGPAVCPQCDCGITDGLPWTPIQAYQKYANAHDRLVSIPDDPMWAEYEEAYQRGRGSPMELT